MIDPQPQTESTNVSATTRWRDSRRTPEELGILQLARELEALTKQYPRFRKSIHQLQAFVRNQLQPLEKKQAALIECMSASGHLFDRDELTETTKLDPDSVDAGLAALVAHGAVEELNRMGNPPARHRSGRPTEQVYYRMRRAAGPSMK